MSNNTNTLFWIITGAVIILAVFLLISNNQNESLNRINSKFSGFWNGSERANQDNTNNEVDWGYDYSQYHQINHCGSNIYMTPDNRIKVTSHHLVTDEEFGVRQGYFVENVSNETISNKLLDTDIYDCLTGKPIIQAALSLDDFKPGDIHQVYMSGGLSNYDGNYFMKPYIKDWD